MSSSGAYAVRQRPLATRPATVGVTGAAGFIGSHLCERLLDEGRRVVGVDDLSHGSLGNLEALRADPCFSFEQLDCCSTSKLHRAFASCEAIVHLAGEKIPRYGGALKTLQGNVAGAKAVYDVALAIGAHVVIASTSDVYGNATPPFAEDAGLTLGPPTTRRWQALEGVRAALSRASPLGHGRNDSRYVSRATSSLPRIRWAIWPRRGASRSTAASPS
jgi:nucleoside-diphosphate-sugar epimerase